MLIRALLTNEFMGVPRRLNAIEATIREMKIDIESLKTDVAILKTDVGHMKGDILEFRLPRRVRSFLSQKLALRRARIMQSIIAIEADPNLTEPVAEAYENGAITLEQESRIDVTDIILRTQRSSDRSTVWVAVEASNTINEDDINKARQSADTLRLVFDEDTLAVVVGYNIHQADMRRAGNRGVEVFVLEPES